jgi:hypothetical protein
MSDKDYSHLPELIRHQASISTRPRQLYTLKGIADQVDAMVDELESARRSLAAIKAADPDLFDPRGGDSRGAAYETYGSAGHELRGKFLAAIDVEPMEDEDND